MDGVINAESGYANGYGISPNYRSITQFKNKYNDNNFVEVVKITFNSNAVSLENILKHFFCLYVNLIKNPSAMTLELIIDKFLGS